MVSLKNRRAGGSSQQKFTYKKKAIEFWSKVLWTDETKISLYQNDGKRKAWKEKDVAHDPKLSTSSVK